MPGSSTYLSDAAVFYGPTKTTYWLPWLKSKDLDIAVDITLPEVIVGPDKAKEALDESLMRSNINRGMNTAGKTTFTIVSALAGLPAFISAPVAAVGGLVGSVAGGAVGSYIGEKTGWWRPEVGAVVGGAIGGMYGGYKLPKVRDNYSLKSALAITKAPEHPNILPKELFTTRSGEVSDLTLDQQLYILHPKLQQYPKPFLLSQKGEPLAVKHGTVEKFDKFDPKTWKYGALGEGFYFRRGPSVFSNKPILLEAFVRLKNPLKLTDARREKLFEDYYYNHNGDVITSSRIKHNGHDGVLVDYGNEFHGKPLLDFELVTYNPKEITIIKRNGISELSNTGFTRPISVTLLKSKLNDKDFYYHATASRFQEDPFTGDVQKGSSFYETFPKTNFYKINGKYIKGGEFIIKNQNIDIQSPGNYYYFLNPKSGQWFETSFQQGGKLIKYDWNPEQLDFSSWFTYRNTLPKNLQDDSDYNLKEAYEVGMAPRLEDDDLWHLGSRNPRTGKILKDASHHTWLTGILSDMQKGYFPVFKDGHTYTQTWKGNEFKSGGSIHIKPKNKGKFTAAAKAHGKSVLEYAKDVVNDPNATTLLKRRALFAINAKKFKH